MSPDRTIAINLGKGEDLTQHKKDLKKIYRDLKQFGNLWTFDEKEKRALDSLRDLVECYVTQPDAQRPHCIGIFGAPGSGKSRSVKEIRALLKKKGEDKAVLDKRYPWISFNLTQVPDPISLSKQLRYARHRRLRQVVLSEPEAMAP